MTREEIQLTALNKLKEHKFVGTFVASMGVGKGKVGIDCIKEGKFKSILITSPRTNLKEMWKNELYKWGFNHIAHPDLFSPEANIWSTGETSHRIIIENIQTCYKWSEDIIKTFDFIICDECHLIMSPKYIRLLQIATELKIPIVSLTGTPDLGKEDKKLMYDLYCPIRYTYLNSAKDKIINDTRYIIYEYSLSNGFILDVEIKGKYYSRGEYDYYKYLDSQVDRLTEELRNKNINAFAAIKYIDKYNAEDRISIFKYMAAIRKRKDFLNTLMSSRLIAKSLGDYILGNSDSKVLYFSELTEQANKLSEHRIHSHNSIEYNTKKLEDFNTGRIRELSSVNSLSLGLNLNKSDVAIFESYNSSNVQSSQKAGRLHRLKTNDLALCIILLPKATQREKYFEKTFKTKLKEGNHKYVKTLPEFIEAYQDFRRERQDYSSK